MNAGPEFEWIIQYIPRIPRADLDRVQASLRTSDPFVGGLFLSDPYDVTKYLPRQEINREEYTLLVDRNIVARWIETVSGRKLTAAHRQAAAVMTFAHAADFMIEPNIAFYELATHFGRSEVLRELSLFYACVNAPTASWADVALSKRDQVDLMESVPFITDSPSPDLERPLYRWKRNYILALKLAELHLHGGKPVDLMAELMRWMYDDFLIGGPALQLASFYLAPGGPRRRLLKGIESPNRDRALAGVKNAAWDLTLVSEWLRLVDPLAHDPSHKSVFILCTLDQAVLRLARSIVSFDDTPFSEEAAIFRTFATTWESKDARRLAQLLHEYQLNAAGSARALHKHQADGFIDALIAEGEAAVRSFTKPGRGA